MIEGRSHESGRRFYLEASNGDIRGMERTLREQVKKIQVHWSTSIKVVFLRQLKIQLKIRVRHAVDWKGFKNLVLSHIS